MRLLNLRPKSGVMPAATHSRDGEPYEHMTPRLGAIRTLREHIADGLAGLDPYDPSIFILNAHEHERTWAYRALELTGVVMNLGPWENGGKRFRAVLEADVRGELGLDVPGAPTMDDEPLASRGVASVTPLPTGFSTVMGFRDTDLLDEAQKIVRDHCDLLGYDTAPVAAVEITNSDSPAMAALERARHAWQGRQVH